MTHLEDPEQVCRISPRRRARIATPLTGRQVCRIAPGRLASVFDAPSGPDADLGSASESGGASLPRKADAQPLTQRWRSLPAAGIEVGAAEGTTGGVGRHALAALGTETRVHGHSIGPAGERGVSRSLEDPKTQDSCLHNYLLSSGHMELGLSTFADLSSGVTPERRMQHLLEEATLADELGLDVFAVGEHHRPDFLVSSPAVVLAAIAVKTKRIRLSSAVTVLSSDDPVRVFQEFAHVDLLSGGRAEIMAGRGSFVESFPLFGYDLDDYDELFAEKLELLLTIRSSERVTWSGRHRAPLDDATVWPRPMQNPLPVWVAVGGTPQSVVRAGVLGLPLTIAIIGGEPERFVPLVELYREALASAGHDPAAAKIAINTHAFVGETSDVADKAFAPGYLAMMNRIGRERGWPPSGRPEYEALRSPRGALAVGSAEQVAEKILFEHELFGHQRYVAQMSVGAVDHRDVLRSIELFGTQVAPVVRAEVARRLSAAALPAA
jgi:probable LLM family oxidoreductase